VKRVFWVAVGAAGGVWVYKRGTRTVEEIRDRGVMGNLNYAADQVRRGRMVAAALVANVTPMPDYGQALEEPPESTDEPVDLTDETLWVNQSRPARSPSNGSAHP